MHRYTLSEYAWRNFPELIIELLEGKSKLVALIIANSDTYFFPGSWLGSFRAKNDLKSFPSDAFFKSWAANRATSGRYELIGLNPVIEKIEAHVSYQLDPFNDDITFRSLDFIEHSHFLIEGKGEGELLELKDGNFASLKIPTSRIVIEPTELSPSINADVQIPTKEFEAVLLVHKEFWADGKNGAKKETIVQWIVEKYGFSQKTSEVIDTICRPENRRSGGNVKLQRA